MKWYEILVLLFICDALQYPIFCSQERARQLVTNQNDVNKVYTLQVDIQILAEQFNSLVDVLSEIADKSEGEEYHWEASYLVDQGYNEIAFEQITSENNVTHQEEYDLMIGVQRAGIQVINFLIWGLRD
jgi:hypothetical protein